MSITTDMRDHYIAAEVAILGGQSYRWGDRFLTRADLVAVQNGRREWERKAIAEANGTNVGVSLANLSGMPQVHEGGEGDYPWYHG